MVVGLALVVVQSRHTFHAVPYAKFLCKVLKHLLRLILRVDFGQGNNQFPCFNTLSICAAALKFLLTFLCKIAPKGVVCGLIGGVQIFLSCVAGDIGFFQVLYVETFFRKESFVIEIISVRTVVFI